MLRKKSLAFSALGLMLALSMLIVGVAPGGSGAASHREAPLIALDPAADITDFFMFRSYEPGHENNLVLIMDVIPGEEPSSGPNYYNFDPNVLYTFYLDNDKDGKANGKPSLLRLRRWLAGRHRSLCRRRIPRQPPDATTLSRV